VRRWLWLALLPVVWVPLIGLLVTVGPRLPWYAWVFAVLFVFMLRRRRHGSEVAPVEGLAGSPTLARKGF
jgi:hypothetical protein